MKNLKNLGFLFTLFALSMMIVSCEDDGTGGGGDEFPDVNITAASADFTVDAGDTIYINVAATATTSQLNTIQVNENGVKLDDITRILWNGAVIANPLLLVGTEKDAATYEIGIIASSEISTTNTYTVIVTDDANRNVTSGAITVTTQGLPPSLTTSMMSGTVTASTGSLQGYPLSGTVGSGQLSTITVLGTDGSPISAERIFWAGPVVAENPFALDAAYIDGFTDIDLQVRTLSEATTETLTVVLTDVNGLTSTQEFIIITEEPKTAVDIDMGVLFNQSGPEGTGGLDLDEGVGTGSMSSLAEIRDLGNDSNTGDWRMQIAPVNDSEIRIMVAGQNGLSESFSFGSVEFKEDLADFFANGSTYSSETVNVGDVFGVTKDGIYYIIQIAAINVTTGDNMDNYEVDIIR